MQLRYSFCLDPTPGQRIALAKALGCARFVYNAALAARKASYEAGGGWIPGGVLSKRLITDAKKDPETAFCGAAHDRDVNAAKNVLHLGKQLVAAGRAETENACRGQIRPPLAVAPADEAGTRRSEHAGTTR